MVKAHYNFKGTGRLGFYNDSTYETLRIEADMSFVDDFLGTYLQKYVANENTVAFWKTVETNLNTGIALVDDAVGGIAAIILDSDDNAEVGCMYWGDNQTLDITKKLIIEFRLTFHVLPTTGTETVQAVFGVASAHNTTLDNIATNAWFRVESAAQTALLYESDDATTDDDDNDASTTLVADTYHIFRIDFTDNSNVRFYVDGVQVGVTDMSAITASGAKVQPYINLSKGKSVANTGTGTIYLDYVKAWQNRS